MAWQTIDGELVLLRLNADELIGVNEVGARVWDLADGSRDVAQIVHDLSDEFDVGEDVARADVQHFLEELEGIGAIEVRGPEAGA